MRVRRIIQGNECDQIGSRQTSVKVVKSDPGVPQNETKNEIHFSYFILAAFSIQLTQRYIQEKINFRKNHNLRHNRRIYFIVES